MQEKNVEMALELNYNWLRNDQKIRKIQLTDLLPVRSGKTFVHLSWIDDRFKFPDRLKNSGTQNGRFTRKVLYVG